MRLFIASKVSSGFKKEISRIIDFLSASTTKVKWAGNGNLHFTYHFLGECDEASFALANRAVSALPKMTPFTIKLNEIGAFPDIRRPSIIWAGVADEKENIKRIWQYLADNLINSGFKLDKRTYIPHLTLGRIKDQRNIDDIKQRISTVKFKPVETTISSVELIKSELTPNGPIYSTLHEHEF
jgi:RNA 2',3'-cyclic 3'-phosphodiesterase